MLEKGRRNEALDCVCMADAAAESFGLSRAPWDRLEKLRGAGKQKDMFVAGDKDTSQPAVDPAGGNSPAARDNGAATRPAAQAVQTSAPARRRVPWAKRHLS